MEGRDLCVALVQVQGASGVLHGGVLPLLDAQAQHLEGQVAQSPGLRFPPSLRGPHQRREPGGVPDHLAGVAQQQRLSGKRCFGKWSVGGINLNIQYE